MKKYCIVWIGMALIAGDAVAQQISYVNDELTITMRSGASTQHQIIRTLKSGTKLEILETNPDNGYSLARTSNGTEGWVLTHYLSNQPIARERLIAANSKIEQLNKELTELRGELKSTSNERNTLGNTSSQLEKENSALKKELKQIKDISRNAIAINEDNKTLREKLIHTETQLQTLEQQNSVLKDRSARDWFITGTGVTIIGIIIGLLVPRLRLQRKPKWNEL